MNRRVNEAVSGCDDQWDRNVRRGSRGRRRSKSIFIVLIAALVVLILLAWITVVGSFLALHIQWCGYSTSESCDKRKPKWGLLAKAPSGGVHDRDSQSTVVIWNKGHSRRKRHPTHPSQRWFDTLGDNSRLDKEQGPPFAVIVDDDRNGRGMVVLYVQGRTGGKSWRWMRHQTKKPFMQDEQREALSSCRKCFVSLGQQCHLDSRIAFGLTRWSNSLYQPQRRPSNRGLPDAAFTTTTIYWRRRVHSNNYLQPTGIAS